MSWVRSRIADLEAGSGTSAGRATTLSSCSPPAASARSAIPAADNRERLHVQPSIETIPSFSGASNANEDDRTAEDLLDAGSQQMSASSSAADVRPFAFTADTHQHHEGGDDPVTSLAGGYYAKPKKLQVARESEAEAARRRSASAAALVHQEQAENKRMARMITQLEATLAASEGRIAHLISSSARAAENASRLRREAEVASAVKEDYARRICQLEETLAQAEKRASWLQGELEVVWACGTQRVAELEYDLELARRKQLATAGEENLSPEVGSIENESTTEQGSTDTSGGSSFSGGSSGGGRRRHGVVLAPQDELDKMMSDTQKALSSLRTKFYRAMGEKEKLQARCAGLENKLLENANGSSTATAFSNSSNGNNTDETNTCTYTGEDNSNQRNALRGHRQTMSDIREATQSCGDRNRESGKERTNRGGGGVSRSRSSRSNSSRSNTSSASSSTVSSTASSTATVAVKAAPVTTVGGKFYSWRWSTPARTGPRLSVRDDE